MTQSQQSRTAALMATSGILAWIVILVGLTIANGSAYNSLTQPGSELSLGRQGWLMDIGFFLLGIGVASLGYALSAVLDDAKWVARLLWIVGLLLFLSGVFHTEMGSGMHPSIHNTLGLVAFVFSITAMFLASHSFKGQGAWHSMARPTRLWAFVALGAFFLVPILGEDWLGLTQRIFVATLFSWFLTCAIRTHRISMSSQTSQISAAPAA